MCGSAGPINITIGEKIYEAPIGATAIINEDESFLFAPYLENETSEDEIRVTKIAVVKSVMIDGKLRPFTLNLDGYKSLNRREFLEFAVRGELGGKEIFVYENTSYLMDSFPIDIMRSLLFKNKFPIIGFAITGFVAISPVKDECP